MKPGDIIRCGEEMALVLEVTNHGAFSGIWLECLWDNGNIEGIDHDDVEVINENR